MPDLLERLTTALVDRYAVEREIGRGGMATVFLAEDLKHHRKVAIKVLHPELASTVGGDRFLREIEIAARLDHPHILPLHDSGEADGILYYVMPYVEGESLHDRLEREKQLPIDLAVNIAREVADGLGCAHRQGVIHRDIKPANVMLSEGHALIADFGVARAVGGEGQTLTSTGLAVGTPAYMSPEQASGSSDVDERSDQYALGCVLYEMLAGAPPLAGPTPQATAAMRLMETATPLQVIRETVPGGVVRVVNRMLAKAPADRYASTEDVVEALGQPDLWAESKPTSMRWTRVLGSMVAASVLVAVVAIAALWIAGRVGGLPVAPHRVAVLPFENLTEDPSLDDLGRSAAERITALLETEQVGEVVLQRTVESMIQAAGAGDPVRAAARATGASLVITGGFSAVGDSLAFSIRIQDSATGTPEGSLKLTSALGPTLDASLDEIASRLAGGLLLAFDDRDPLWTMSGFPKIEAYRLYREGRALSYDRELSDALDRLYGAWELDTTFVLPLFYATGATHQLGDYETADSLNRFIGDRYRADMSDGQRYYYDGTRAWFARDFEAAYRAQRRVVTLQPQSWTHRQTLTVYLFATNRPHEAAEVLLDTDAQLGEVPEILPWQLTSLAAAHHMIGDHHTELEESRDLEELGWGNPLIAKFREARALAALGQAEAVRLAQDQLESLADTSATAGLYMLVTALEMQYHGFRENAEAALQRAVRWFEERPASLSGEPRSQVLYGAALYHVERWAEAEALLTALEAESLRDVDVLGYSGLLAARRGDADSAAGYAHELDQIGRDDYNSRAHTWVYRARIAAVLGERVEAVAHLRRAFDEGLMYVPYPDLKNQYRFDFEGLSDYAPYQELLRPQG